MSPDTREIRRFGVRVGLLVLCLFLLPIIFVFLFRLYPENADLVSLIPKFGPLPAALALAYSVLRYRFMDVVLKKSLLYSLLSGLLLGLYLFGVKYGAEWLFPAGGLHPVVFDLIVILVLIFAFQPLKAGLQKGIDRFFFRRHIEIAEVLKSFSQTLTTWSDLEGLCQSFVKKVTESLGLSHGAILLADGTMHGLRPSPLPSPFQGEGEFPLLSLLTENNSRMVVVEELAAGPLKSACREAGVGLVLALPCREQKGWLLLGEKWSGEPFLSEETALIEAVCGQLAVAIDNLFLMQSKIALEREVQHREKLAAIGQLAATLAHEIRNPITGAKCLLQQVEEDMNGTPQGKEYVHLALEDLERVEQSVSQLLTFARKEEYRFAEQDVTELVESTVHSFIPRAQEKGVTVQLQGGVPIGAAIDGEKIHRTLLNLLANALDAVDEARGESGRVGGIIVVSVYAKGSEVGIRVSDNGHGLAIEDQDRIFEPFFTRKEKGTGLGLAIAKKIVEGHGGRITAVSTPGQGTMFTIALPRGQLDTRTV